MRFQLAFSVAVGLVVGAGAFASAAIVLPNGDPDPAYPALKVWLKADADVYTVADTTLATNGQTVAQWKNQTTGAAVASHATQGTANNKPLLISSSVNGLPAVRFDGANATADGDWLGGSGISLTAAKTIFVVMRDTGTLTDCCSGTVSTNGNYNALGTKRVGSEIRLNIDWAGSGETGATNILNQNIVAVLTWNTTGSIYGRMFLNGALDDTDSQNKAAAATTYWLGTRRPTDANRFFMGDIAEVLIYDGELDRYGAEQNAIGYYLGRKYGINTSYTPEPSALAMLLGLGSLGLLGCLWRRRRT